MRRPRRGPRRSTAAAAALAAAAVLLAGCGIRSTSVPVDEGAAPSRVACVLPGDGTGVAPRSGTRVQLVCGARVIPVTRQVRLPGDGAGAARTLLAQLTAEPEDAERAAGFASDVPRGLKVAAGTGADPAGALRLSTAPDRLKGFAVAQIVCTFAGTAASAQNGQVLLGGPAAEPVRRYACDRALRNSPQAAQTAGVPV
jgi:hypothetical protein